MWNKQQELILDLWIEKNKPGNSIIETNKEQLNQLSDNINKSKTLIERKLIKKGILLKIKKNNKNKNKNKKIDKNIKELISIHNLSIKEIAELLGVHYITILRQKKRKRPKNRSKSKTSRKIKILLEGLNKHNNKN